MNKDVNGNVLLHSIYECIGSPLVKPKLAMDIYSEELEFRFTCVSSKVDTLYQLWGNQFIVNVTNKKGWRSWFKRTRLSGSHLISPNRDASIDMITDMVIPMVLDLARRYPDSRLELIYEDYKPADSTKHISTFSIEEALLRNSVKTV